jgi:hypothetical protein
MRLSRAAAVVLLLLIATGLPADDKKKAAQNFSTLRFSVIKDDNEKPVRNASVVLHPVNKEGKQSAGGLQLKTDSEGKTVSEGIPYGKLRVQVLAPGFQTYGEDFKISEPETTINVRLKRPRDQFTIYDKPADNSQPGSTPPPQSPPK